MSDPDPLPMEGNVLWDSPALVAFAQAARACYLAGSGYDHLKDILATVDELTPAEMRYSDPDDTFDEPLSDYQRSQIEEGLADAEAGRLTPHAEVVAEIQRRRQAK